MSIQLYVQDWNETPMSKVYLKDEWPDLFGDLSPEDMKSGMHPGAEPDNYISFWDAQGGTYSWRREAPDTGFPRGFISYVEEITGKPVYNATDGVWYCEWSYEELDQFEVVINMLAMAGENITGISEVFEYAKKNKKGVFIVG